MLSIENPPPCSCEISQLRSSGDTKDEKDYDNRQQLQLDLSSFDDNTTKFSLRDYVFDTRSKDIQNNWPFSQKILKLCLKDGVKDLLPPFQSFCSKGISSDKENISNYNQKYKLKYRSIDHLVSVSSCNVGGDQELVVDCENINSIGSEEDKEFPSTTVNHSNKIISSVQSPIEKCRLIVKLSNIVDPRSNEDPVMNTSVPLGTMASKVCPVCKTFSSTSNTTLNAHIDQCLSGESTIKVTSNSKVTKHRIKPRKIRLMVDIYETAPYCTLEELDRRNGTNWALNLGIPAQNIETCTEERHKTPSPVNREETVTNKDSAVYTDSSGTKLRILSKFNDLQTFCNSNDDFESMKLVKRNKESNILLSKKKKNNLVQKHHKLLKHVPHGQRGFVFRPDHCSNSNDGGGRKLLTEKSLGKDGCMTQPTKSHDLVKLNHLGIIKQWIGSKRSDLTKKINGKDEYQQSHESVGKNLRAKCHQSSTGDPITKRSNLLTSGDPITKRSSLLTSQALPDVNQLSPPESSKRKEKLSTDSREEYVERSLRKSVNCLLLKSKDLHYKKNYLVLSKYNVKQLRKGGLSADDAPSESNKRAKIDISTAKHADSSVMNPKPSGRKMFSSSTEHMLSVGGTSVFGSKTKMKRKLLDVKKLRLRYMSKSDEEAIASHFAVDPQHDLVEKLSESEDQMKEISDRKYVERTMALKIRKKSRKFMISKKEEAMALRSSLLSPESYGHDAVESLGKEVVILEDIVSEPASEMANGDLSIVLSNSMDPRVSEDADPLVSQHYIEAFKEHYPAELVFDGEHKMFCADGHMVAELDIDEGQGKYFVGVDPIPIPGPPGSFLPSPGRMGSEDLQGNSSLTTCRIQSSEDDHELVDRGSSYSPTSAISAISDSVAARSDSISLEKLPARSPVGNEIKSGFSGVSIGPFVVMSTPLEPTASAGEGNIYLDGSKVDSMFPEMGSLKIKTGQPCCCSRKEGASTAVAFNYQDSELWQHTLASRSLPADEKQMIADPKRKFDSSNFRTEMLIMREPSPIAEANVANSPKGDIPKKVLIDSEVEFSSHGDFESATPATSNPVLRLMGKNLMVVKKDEDVTAPSSITNVHAKQQFYADNGISPGRFQEEDHSFHRVVSKDPLLFYRAQNHTLSQRFDHVVSSSGFKIQSSVSSPLSSIHPPVVQFSCESFGGSFRSSTECLEYIGSCNLSIEQQGSKNRLGVPVTSDMDKLRSPGYNINMPVGNADSDIKTTHMTGRESTVGISASMNVDYDSRNVNPLYSYQSQGYSMCSESPVVLNASVELPRPKEIKASPVNWNRSPEWSSVLHPNSLTAPSSSTCHLKSELHYSPHMS